MKRYILFIVVAFFAFNITASAAISEDTELIIDQELSAFDFSKWSYNDADFSLNAESMIRNYLNGKGNINTQGIVDFVASKLKSVILSKIPLMLMLLACGMMSGLCSSLVPSEKSEIAEVLTFVCSAMCVAAVAGAVYDMVKSTAHVINAVSSFTEAAMPVLSLIMIASGRKATEAVFSPAMAFLSGTLSLLMKTLVIPIIVGGFVFATVCALGDRTQNSKMLGLSKSSVKWICGIMTTVFTGAVTIYGLGAKAHDTLTMKTTKYVIDKSVPIVGSFLSGTADTVLECFTAIKTASGAVFMIIVVLICAKPLFDICGTILSLRIAAALCEPLADKKLPKLMSDTADIADLLFGAVAILGVMLMIAVGLCTCILS